MINHSKMMELSALAQDTFPMRQEQALMYEMTGDRRVFTGLIEERVLWMLNEAYKLGKAEK